MMAGNVELCGRPGCGGHIEHGSCVTCRTPVRGAPGPECPACGAMRRDREARFCEVCWYDYAFEAPAPQLVARAADPAQAEPVPAEDGEWEVRVVVDLRLDVEPDTGDAPLDAGERRFPVDRPEMLVGRRDDQHGIRPDIAVLDPGVSRRHASLLHLRGGRLAILDLASANGTMVNGVELTAGQRRELGEGDTVTIGRWTRITVHRLTD
jgi:hypothetical protein